MISVIIPTYNRCKMVVDCITSVLATGYSELDVIVVDDCSPDFTNEELLSRFANEKRLRVIRNERNCSLAVSRNRGAAIAKGEYLFFLDDDNVVDENILNELLAVFAHDERIALVAPLAIQNRRGTEPTIWTLGCDFNRWTSQPGNHLSDLPLSKFNAYDKLFPTTYSPNAFMVRRTAYDQVGGFDESFIITYEESDFGWRLMESGYTAYIAPKAKTLHLGYVEPGSAPTLRLLGIEKIVRTRCFARNRLKFARRHFSRLQYLSVALIFAPLSALYYCTVALRNHRPDIALAYLKGTLEGVLYSR